METIVTEEMLAKVRGRIGKPWVPKEPWFNVEATKDTIRHFVNGIGDENPLYVSEEYARKTRYGRLIAPPTFLYSVYTPGGMGAAMPKLHAWLAGNDWEWYKPILVGDSFTCTDTLTEIKEKPSKKAKKSYVAYSVAEYTNQRGEIVARGKGWTVWATRETSKEIGKDAGIAAARYSDEELQKIYEDYEREVIRGAEPCYWEDIQVGTQLTPVVKGPLSQRDIIAFLMGWGGLHIKAHKLFVKALRRHPSIGMFDPETGAVDIAELVHLRSATAGEVGVAGAYDYGGQRICWLGHMLTNWMGDDGFLKRLYAELRAFNMVGDTTWCKGKVTRKYVQNGEHLVDIEGWAENQRGEVTMLGQAVVALPFKG